MRWFRLLIAASLIIQMPSAFGQRRKQQQGPPQDVRFPLENIYADRKPDRFRKILNHFSLMPHLGMGQTAWSHSVSDYMFYRKGEGDLILFNRPSANEVPGHASWVTSNPVQTVTIGTPDPDEFLVDTDTASIRFRGSAPVRSLGLRFMGRISRFNGGIGLSRHWFQQARLDPSRFASRMGSTNSSSGTVTSWHYSAYLSYEFYKYYKWRLRADAEAGRYALRKRFSADGFQPSVTIGVGLTARWELSEYLSWFIRPSIDRWSYSVRSAETGVSLKHNLLTANLSTGFIYTFPELRRCYHKLCRVQINHPHGNREYRSRAHPIYKKQNPGYGENYPEPVKPNRPNR